MRVARGGARECGKPVTIRVKQIRRSFGMHDSLQDLPLSKDQKMIQTFGRSPL